jgi:hypothetical protein
VTVARVVTRRLQSKHAELARIDRLRDS